MASRRELGKAGEDLALSHLLSLGYTLLERNYRGRRGEIDLVLRDGETVVFVEVKRRTSGAFGLPEEAVDGRKQRRIAAVAAGYLARHGLADRPCRFDVVAVQGGEVRHLIGAF